MRGQRRRQDGAAATVHRVEPQGPAQGAPGSAGEQRVQRRRAGWRRHGRPAGLDREPGIRMIEISNLHDTRQRAIAQAQQLRRWARRRPWAALALLLGAGMLCGAAARSAIGMAQVEALQTADAERQARAGQVRRDAQRDVNALAARLAELQAQANRLNALGERLTRVGQLQDGEFDFEKPVGQGGGGIARDMPPAELRARPGGAGSALPPGRHPAVGAGNAAVQPRAGPQHGAVARADRRQLRHLRLRRPRRPVRRRRQFHKGIDFQANIGDPVLAVADGVVSFAGVAQRLRQRGRDRPRQRLRHPLRAQLAPGPPGRRPGARRRRKSPRPAPPAARPAPTCTSKCGRTAAWSIRASSSGTTTRWRATAHGRG